MAVRITGQASSTDQANLGNPGGTRSRAEGTSKVTNANAFCGHAEGASCTVSGFAGHAEGSNTTAGGGSAAHSEGNGCVASGSNSHAEGDTCSATASGSHAQGYSTFASATGSHAEGNSSQTWGGFSRAQGAYGHAGRYLQQAHGGGRFAATGDAQVCTLVLMRATSDATPALLTSGGSAVNMTGESVNVPTITTNRVFGFRIALAARRSDTGHEVAMWTFDGIVSRDSVAANPAIITGPVASRQGMAASAAWMAALTVDSSNTATNYLAITVTGEAGKTIRWVARVEWVEVG